MLKPQDIVVLLKIHSYGNHDWRYAELASNLSMSASEVHAALKRAQLAGLYEASSRQLRNQAILEFLIHGLKYVFHAQPGPLSRGIPTAHSAEPLKNLLITNPESTYVWADPSGTVKGQTIIPLYRSVPVAVKNDPELHELLSLVDAIRVGRVREQQLASQLLEQRFAVA
jgi:hypothetical protein